MVRSRPRKSAEPDESPTDADGGDPGMDVNAVVSYNLRAIRERRGMTQQDVAHRLAGLTGHLLPQASISAMERGFDGDRRRRFDAHELYLLSVVFGVPIIYFFIPPRESGLRELADTRRPLSELYVSLLGRDHELVEVDERLTELNLSDPEEVDNLAAAVFGGKEAAARNWHDHYRTWRKKRLVEIARNYGDRLDEVAEFLAEFANQITQIGPKAYLQMKAHKEGEKADPSLLREAGED
jgi:transcriptional regulator with XRE-family HTH domain